MVSYWLGRLGSTEKVLRWLHLRPELLERVHPYVRRWGTFAAFWSFLPIVGDAIPVVLGFLRAPWLWVLFWMALGKAFRFMALAYLGWQLDL